MKALNESYGYILRTLIGGFFLFSVNAGYSQNSNRVKPRVIATTDGEVDDRSTFVRFLLYSCDFDVVGIVQNNSKYQKSGHSKDKWVEKELDAYASVLPNLRKHNPDYPDTDYLRSIVTVGNENSSDLNVAPPNMATKNTAGEKFIIKTLLDNDPRPVHIGAWGGCNTIASALWTLKTQYTAAQFKLACSKIRIYAIWYQDGGGQWIEDNIKEAFIYEAYGWDNVWDYQSYDGSPKGGTSSNPKDVQAYMKPAWLDANVKKNHGPLGAITPQSYISEGDTPSWFNLVNNGLESHEDYTLGGWGGRGAYDSPSSKPNHITDQSGVTDDGDKKKMFWRWAIAAQNDFAGRMDWCVATKYADANHQPVAKIVGDNVRTVTPGQTVTFDATPTKDPDNNTLTYSWWQYYDADNASAKPSISNNTSKDKASLVVPNEVGKQLHVILEVTDNGTPQLKGYQRIILNISQTTSVSDENISQTVAIYPNPSNATFQVNLPAASNFQVFDVEGKMLEEHKNVSNISFGENLKQGVYFLKTDNKVHKLIKE
jgi:hypothetical protein